ncbi:MAG: hypothetical protein C4519_11350 [Desulfobacteraceae bacterium]|nr:MAG: hypothetical protein C4519_11350 [Desulfobacteraceae bacterium]
MDVLKKKVLLGNDFKLEKFSSVPFKVVADTSTISQKVREYIQLAFDNILLIPEFCTQTVRS